ncbi:hypothetical protein DXG01_001192 [Tephrocybe rancida]|nr:hypothetical protein DXG01_001192 [Tephrocybe rancida]
MILDSKILSPPPPYVPSSPFSRRASLRSLPPHILLHIIHLTFPSPLSPDTDPERARTTLYWLAISLRLVDRTLYAACMHILRSTHIPAYDALVRPPYTSDPFPLLSPHSPSPAYTQSPYGPRSAPQQSATQNDANPGPLSTIQRETAVLDKFIALKVREDVWADASELHLERGEAYRDLFDHAQPRARLEDLVRDLGVRSGIICVGAPPEPSSSSAPYSGQAGSESNVTLVTPPPEPAPEEDTESKPRLFPPGSTYHVPSYSPPSPTYTSYSPTASASTLSLLPHRGPPTPTRKASTSFLSSWFSPSSASASKSRSPPTGPQHQIREHQTREQQRRQPIPMHLITVSLAPRSAGLVLLPARRTVVSTPRTREEPLERVAGRLVRELGAWVGEGA